MSRQGLAHRARAVLCSASEFDLTYQISFEPFCDDKRLRTHTVLNSARTIGRVCRRDDNSREEVQNVRGHSSAAIPGRTLAPMTWTGQFPEIRPRPGLRTGRDQVEPVRLTRSS